MSDLKVRAVHEDSLEFPAFTKDEVLYIPAKMDKLAERICKEFDLTIDRVEGNFEETVYYFTQGIDENTAEAIYHKYG